MKFQPCREWKQYGNLLWWSHVSTSYFALWMKVVFQPLRYLKVKGLSMASKVISWHVDWMKVIRQRLAFQIPLCQVRGTLFQTRVGEIAWSAFSSLAATQILVNQFNHSDIRGSDQLSFSQLLAPWQMPNHHQVWPKNSAWEMPQLLPPLRRGFKDEDLVWRSGAKDSWRKCHNQQVRNWLGPL